METMVELCNDFGRWLLDHLWWMSLELTILAALVLAVLYLLRVRSPALRHLFWGLVLAKPVVTFLVASPISIYGFFHPVPPRVPVAAPVVVRTVGAVPGPVGDHRFGHSQGAFGSAGVSGSPAASAWRELNRFGIFGLIWAAGALVLSVRLGIGWAFVHFLMKTAERQDSGPLVEIVDRAGETLGLRRRVPVGLSQVAHGPVLAGIWRPMILLPVRLSEELSPRQMMLVILHELAHVRRFDNLVLFVQRLAEIVLFFHPVVWLCGYLMRREAEAACDDAVIEACGGWSDGVSAAAYAESLTRVAEMRFGLTRRLLVNTFAAAESNFARRVRRILGGKHPRRRLSFTLVTMILFVVLGCLGLPGARERNVRPDDQRKEAAVSNLQGNSRSHVRRENGKVWIENVPSLVWGLDKSRNCTYAGAMEAATAVTEHPCHYTDLMGWSGLAFRVRWNRGQDGKNWTGCSPIGEMSEEINALARATGWESSADWHVDQEDAEKEELALPKIAAAIDAGFPVMAYGASWDMGVIYGYRDGGKTLLFHDYSQGDNFTLPAGKLIGMEIYLGRFTSPLAPKQAVLQGLTMAVKNWHRGHGDGGVPGRDYFYGPAALTAWIDDLGLFDTLTEPQKEKLMHLNQWNLGSLIDARKAAAAFLRQAADQFPPAARDSLRRAADLYEKEAKDLEPRYGKEIGLAKCQGKTLTDWTPTIRQREQKILAEILTTENKAIAQIEQALAAEGVNLTVGVSMSSANTQVRGVRGIPFRPWKNLLVSQVACLKPCLEHMGINVSLPWLYGATGRAFMMNIHEILCPSGWYVADPDEEFYRLGRNLGFTVEHLAGSGVSPNLPGFVEKQKEVWDKTRQALDAGLACYSFDLAACDYQPIYGYDEVGYYYSMGDAKEGKGPYSWQDFGRKGDLPVLYMDVVRRGTAADDRKTVRDVLEFVVKYANRKNDAKAAYWAGLAAYDRWIMALESAKAQGFGAAYNAACYLEARSYAVEFLKEAKARLAKGPDEKLLGPLFDQAIVRYSEVAGQLRQVAELFPMLNTPDSQKAEFVKDKSRCAKAVVVLQSARAAEADGLAALADLAKALGSIRVVPASRD